ncbi:unnamed protein product [Cercospora beticola]|nr:unnamed protein product [Cercospora beticola]
MRSLSKRTGENNPRTRDRPVKQRRRSLTSFSELARLSVLPDREMTGERKVRAASGAGRHLSFPDPIKHNQRDVLTSVPPSIKTLYFSTRQVAEDVAFKK